jgi:hypothetical protein
MSERTEALRLLLIAQASTPDRYTSDRLQHKIDDLVDKINKENLPAKEV